MFLNSYSDCCVTQSHATEDQNNLFQSGSKALQRAGRLEWKKKWKPELPLNQHPECTVTVHPVPDIIHKQIRSPVNPRCASYTMIWNHCNTCLKHPKNYIET